MNHGILKEYYCLKGLLVQLDQGSNVVIVDVVLSGDNTRGGVWGSGIQVGILDRTATRMILQLGY